MATKGTVTTSQSGIWLAAYPTLSFTLNNFGQDPIYISSDSKTALVILTNGVSNDASTTVTAVVASGSTTGDTSSAYIIQAGTSRTFTYNFSVDNTGGTSANKKLAITQINYGTSPTNATSGSITGGLQNLYVMVALGPTPAQSSQTASALVSIQSVLNSISAILSNMLGSH
jgi:hypothetical protein